MEKTGVDALSFGHQHYVPILKAKRGEKGALAVISAAHRESITPLLEIVELSEESPSIDAHINRAFKGLADAVRSYSRCFLDSHEIAVAGSGAAEQVFQRAHREGIVFTPVTGLTRNVDKAAALSHRENGLALRVLRAEFESGNLDNLFERFLAEADVNESAIDLILDLGSVEDLIVDGIAALSRAFMAEIPNLTKWRTVTVSASAFPRSMGEIERHAHALVDRSEWNAWHERLYRRRHELERLPTFSDCAIQHPEGVEGFNPRLMQVSATIRYTLEREWLLIKGESTRSVAPSAQFPQIATRLVYGHLRSHFAGPTHCRGCALMKAAADGQPGLGSAEAWRKLGTIHHVSTVVKAVASLA